MEKCVCLLLVGTMIPGPTPFGHVESFSPMHMIPSSTHQPNIGSRTTPFAMKMKSLERLNAQPEHSETQRSTPFDRPVLAAVDISSLLLFAGIGKASHSPDGSLDVGAVALTAAPFVAAWLLTSPLTGVYSPDDRQTNLIKGATIATAKGWVLAVPLGCILRGIIKGYVPPLPFVIVTLISTLIILTVSRIIFSLAEDFFVELVN